MLPKKYRLPAFLIPQVLNKGKRISTKFFNLFVCTTQTLNLGKFNNPKNKNFSQADCSAWFAVIIPNKICKKAVGRNKLRRQVYSIIYSMLPSCNNEFSTIIMVNRGVLLENFTSIKYEVEHALSRAGLFQQSEISK